MTIETPGNGHQPIADLSYRNYDGPLKTRRFRWWIVALANMRLTIRKKAFWIVASIATLPYIFQGLSLYIQSMTENAPMMHFNPMLAAQTERTFALSFFMAFNGQMLWLFIVALMCGANSIAADNQTNALLVYLSKPVTKWDYLIGKWMSVFLTIWFVALAPALIMFIYCMLSYSGDGFLTKEPTLFLRMIVATAIPAFLHASLLVGISAWSKTGRMAGAAYAAFFFITSAIVSVAAIIRFGMNPAKGTLMRHLTVEGVMQGLAQNVYGVTMRLPKFSKAFEMKELTLSPPNPWILLAVFVALCLIGIAAARARIRAVEVVRG
ncbi:MAG: ABC transporter permease subunit [Armatimonadetes bacterium]|jgi:ABC-2 type transport system permease protein|nr:ABC transporter permease subunit [Armatimonadota bacterium]